MAGTLKSPTQMAFLTPGERSRFKEESTGLSLVQRVGRVTPFWPCEQISSSAELMTESMENKS